MIRNGTKEDLHKIAELWKEMVFEARPEWSPDTDSWIKTGSALFDAGIYYIVCYEQDGNIVGFVDGLVYNEPSTGKRHGIAQHYYVLPEYRGTQVAGEIYEEILYLALKNDIEVLELYCFPEMQTFWEDRGFKQERILMRRQVDV